jgi:hypothetical protein
VVPPGGAGDATAGLSVLLQYMLCIHAALPTPTSSRRRRRMLRPQRTSNGHESIRKADPNTKQAANSRCCFSLYIVAPSLGGWHHSPIP